MKKKPSRRTSYHVIQLPPAAAQLTHNPHASLTGAAASLSVTYTSLSIDSFRRQLKTFLFSDYSSVHSALEIFLLMRYINLRLLTYLLWNPVTRQWQIQSGRGGPWPSPRQPSKRS